MISIQYLGKDSGFRSTLSASLPPGVFFQRDPDQFADIVLCATARPVSYDPSRMFIRLTPRGEKRESRNGGSHPLSEGSFSREIRAALDDLVSRIMKDRQDLGEPLPGYSGISRIIIGSSQILKDSLKQAYQYALSGSPVLIQGESGTGKELIAQLIHSKSSARGPFLPVNCGAIVDSLTESLFFGSSSGAFTGASNRRGFLAEADGGSLFLDEIGDLSLSGQVSLLRVLEDGMVTPLGGNRPFHVDFRLICATNLDLKEKIRAKRFRNDLFYRIFTLKMVLPPLRSRREDIPELADFFLKKKDGRKTLSAGALDRLCDYSWPGNVRELSAIIERAVILSGKRDRINPECILLE